MGEELTKTQGGPLVVPDFLKGVAGREGLENVTREDLVLPRLAVCQSMTRERKKQNEDIYIAGLEEGDLFNNLTRRVIKQGEHLDFIPIYISTSRIFFKDIDEGGGILCQSFNGIDGGQLSKTCAACPKSQFTSGAEGSEPPECTEFKNVICKDAGTSELFIASFKSMELKPAKKWITLMNGRVHPKTRQPMPIFSQLYRMSTKPGSNSKGDFFVRVIAFRGFLDDEGIADIPLERRFQLFNEARKDYDAVKGKVIDTAAEVAEHESQSQDEVERGPGYDNAPPPSDDDTPF